LSHIGSIHLAKIFYKGRSGASKVRPVLIIKAQGNRGLFTIVEVTSVPPKDLPGFFDTYKEKINHKKRTGLFEPSFVKCHENNIHLVKKYRLHKKIGRLEPKDLSRIIERISDGSEVNNTCV
jgi:mRNA-degrading endonuclease toxin of MazEF toxin-antitoxin module